MTSIGTSAGPEGRRLWGALLVLLLVVLAPTVCVIWFMNEAVANERLAIRQRMADLYQGELARRQMRLDGLWEKAIEALAAGETEAPGEEFERLIRAGFSSALIYRNGRLAYPAMAGAGDEPTGDRWHDAESLEAAGDFAGATEVYGAVALTADAKLRTRALVGEMRALFRGGQSQRAIEVLDGLLKDHSSAAAADGAGRLLVPSAILLGIESLPAGAPERGALIKRLAERLREYHGPVMPSAQRAFLMERLAALTGEDFPTMEAERMALQVAAVMPQEGAAWWNGEHGAALESVPGMPGRWMAADAAEQAVGIWTSAAAMREFGANLQADAPAGTAIGLIEPGRTDAGAAFLSAPAGSHFPGWSVALRLTGPDPFGAAARRREAAYLWAGCLSIGAIAALAGVLGMFLRRQMQLTRMKNDLIATVSHELKTPLSSMRVLIDTLVEGRVAGKEGQEEYLGLIARENMRLSRLIDNFLTFSRMERGKRTFDMRAVPVEGIVQAALAAMGERAMVVRVNVSPGLVVRGDSDALTTVMLNLLDNAWKYSRTAERRIELTARQLGHEVEIQVRDWGIGIARRHQRRIFGRFYQVDRELSRQTGGCGLGLAIVRFIVKAHHGTVQVSSQAGQGSTFSVRLPAAASGQNVGEQERLPLVATASGEPPHHG